MRVGREQEGTSSNRPEFAAIEAAIRQADEKEDNLYLCDNQSVLTEVNGWIGEGSKATLATAPNVDIMRELLCTLRMCIAAGSATFLIKVKSH
jgi:ribonuclease HI